MATALTLIERVASLLDNYGAASTTLGAAVTDATGTTFTVADSSVASAGDWGTVDGETFEITAIVDTPDAFTVRRGMQGSTAATHLINAVIRINLDITTQRIIEALNLAQSAAYPQLSSIVSDTTLEVVANQWDYETPATIDHVRQVWIETSNSGVYNQVNNWDMSTAGIIRLYQTYSTGRKIKVVGTKRFAALTYAGNIDAAFPTTDATALGYMAYEAAANLVSEQQLRVSKRDGFVGITDAFAQGAPTVSLATGERYREIAQRYLRDATRNMVLPEETLPNMARYYLRRV
jgi:hypothetical protein